jgi:hypothetical protein
MQRKNILTENIEQAKKPKNRDRMPSSVCPSAGVRTVMAYSLPHLLKRAWTMDQM